MKQLLLSVALLLSALVSRAQSANPAIWCPPGATWTYGWNWWSETGTITVRYARDTVVAGQSAQLLTRNLLAHDSSLPNSPSYPVRMPSVVTRTVGSRVEVLGNGNTFYTLYDFAAQPGSTWITPPVVPLGACPSTLVQVVVDSVGTRLIAGQPRRWFRAHLAATTNSAIVGGWSGRIYEQLGSMQYLQPQSPVCGGTDPGYMGGFTSYRATGQPTIGYNAGQLLATATARATAAGFAAYPNPGAGLLMLELPPTATIGTLRLLDLTGRTLRQLPVPASKQLDVSNLPSGTYTLLLEGVGQPALAHRLVVE